MARFTERKYQCRTRSVIKLYKSVYDINATKEVVLANVDFVSNKQYISDTLSFMLISECDDKSKINYWCPMGSIYYFEIVEDVEEPQGNKEIGTKVSKNAIINGANVHVYPIYNSISPIATGLKYGDTLEFDRETDVNNNGIVETRYRISGTSSDDDTIIGKWITHNVAITINDKPVIIESNEITTETTRPKLAVTTVPLKTPTDLPADALTTIDLDTSGVDTNYVVSNIKDGGYYSTKEITNAYNDYINNTTMTTSANDASLMGSPIGRMIFVHGMPFQYTGITDRRIRGAGKWGETNFDPHRRKSESSDVDAYGRSFAANIAANMPIVVMVPGVPTFVTKVKTGVFNITSGGSKMTRGLMSGFFTTSSEDAARGLLESLDNQNAGDYQYYNIKIDTAEYYKYVNSLCQTSARLMSLSETKYHGKRCSELDWGTYNSASDQDYTMFEDVMGADGGVSFAYDPGSSVTDSINNTSSESNYASKFNSISQEARELEFLTGMMTGEAMDIVDSEEYTEAATRTLKEKGLFKGAQNAMNTLKTGLQNASKGMNMRFPEIWQDSSYSKSYDLDMHFIAPYATAFCKWRYVLVPFFHIFALAAPTNKGSVNAYSRPFLIKAFSKGFFNVEMGIIENIQWKRFGDGDMISADGVPMQIDVSISFKDMYQQLAMSSIDGDSARAFFNNTGLVDMIGTLSGVNMNKMSLGDRVALYVASGFKRFRDLDDNFMRSISDRMAQFTSRYLLGM